MKLTKLVLLGIAGVSLVLLPRRSSKPAKNPNASPKQTPPATNNTNHADNTSDDKDPSAS